MEYEYSFNVTNVIEYLKYFKENKFKLISLENLNNKYKIFE